MTSSRTVDALIEKTFALMRVLRHRMMSHPTKEGPSANFLQIHTLMLVGSHEGITMKELAGALHVASPSATSFINRMEKLGWILRAHDPVNRKLVRLRLTDEGKIMLNRKNAMRMDALRELIHHLTPEEQEQLSRILGKLHDSIVSSEK
jgi:DNA-binding MarR family transcriptional regulator